MKIVVYEDELIKEYEVKIDREKLENIKNEIIQNCSMIKYSVTESKKIGYFTNARGYFENNIYIIPLNVDLEEELSYDYAIYSFDKYYVPDIVHIINDILVGAKVNRKVNRYINAYNLQYLFNTSDLDVDKLLDDVNAPFKNALKKVTMMLEKYISGHRKDDMIGFRTILNSIDPIDIEMPKQSILKYYKELYTCFEFIFIRTIDIGNLDKLSIEHEGNWEETLNEVKQISENLKNWGNKDFSPKTFGTILETEEFKERLEKLNNKGGKQKTIKG